MNEGNRYQSTGKRPKETFAGGHVTFAFDLLPVDFSLLR
jgi:hypothetical protein